MPSTSTKLIILSCLTLSAFADDCANFRKVSSGECAEACVPSMVGLCPQSLIVKTGGLDAGHCADVNFTVADGTVDQKCGPCGTITFNKFKQGSTAVNLDPPTGTFCGSLIGIIKENMTVRADNTFDYFNDVSIAKVHVACTGEKFAWDGSGSMDISAALADPNDCLTKSTASDKKSVPSFSWDGKDIASKNGYGTIKMKPC